MYEKVIKNNNVALLPFKPSMEELPVMPLIPNDETEFTCLIKIKHLEEEVRKLKEENEKIKDVINNHGDLLVVLSLSNTNAINMINEFGKKQKDIND